MNNNLIMIGSILSLFRVGSFWLGSFLLSNTADFRQVIGYFLTFVFSVPEILIVRSLRNDPETWKLSLSFLLIVGSYLWVYIIYYLVSKNQYRQ